MNKNTQLKLIHNIADSCLSGNTDLTEAMQKILDTFGVGDIEANNQETWQHLVSIIQYYQGKITHFVRINPFSGDVEVIEIGKIDTDEIAVYLDDGYWCDAESKTKVRLNPCTSLKNAHDVAKNILNNWRNERASYSFWKD